MQTKLHSLQAPVHVLKFGGSSLSTPELIQQVVSIIASHKKKSPYVVVVVSARGKSTDQLIAEAKSVSPNALKKSHQRELDMLVSTGERISMALLCMCLKDHGLDAISFTGSQSGIITDNEHGNAKIKRINAPRIEEALQKNKVVVVAGFQGVSEEKEITTLGRGGSDTTAVAMAHYFKSPEVFLYSDVDGYYSADPRLVKNPQRLKSPLDWKMAYEISKNGAKVVHPRAVQLAWSSKITLNCLSTPYPQVDKFKISGENMQVYENTTVLNVTSLPSLTKISLCEQTVHKLKSHLNGFSEILETCQHPSFTDNKLTFWLTENALKELPPDWKFEKSSPCLKVSLNGYFLKNNIAVLEKFLQILESLSLECQEIIYTDLSLSAFITATNADNEKILVEELHRAFINPK